MKVVKEVTTIGQYLIDKLKEIELEHVFGIPGDYVINFFKKLEESTIKTVGTCSEQGAAFAADGYARRNGIGAVCVTYCVGGLNTVNAIAGAYAEKAPVIVISGAPGMDERDSDYLLHHSIRDFDSQYKVFKNVTCASTQLNDPATAIYEIDRVIETCIEQKRPVYIELPRDMVAKEVIIPPPKTKQGKVYDQQALKEALSEAIEIIKDAHKPVIIGGVEIRRYHQENLFLELVEKSGFPYSTTFLGKSLIDESHPQFQGVYLAKMGKDSIRKAIEESDCVIMLGTVMADTNLGTAQLSPANTIYASVEEVCIKHHYYKNIDLSAFMQGLIDALKELQIQSDNNIQNHTNYQPVAGSPLKISRFIDRLGKFLPDNSIVVSDVGDCLFASANLQMRKNSRYYGPVFYTSMGYAIPAALGIQIKNPELRPIIIVGDGAFQMTGHEISCFALHKLNPIIFVINNHGYTTQRFLKEGSYNNIQNWNYHKITELVGGGIGFEVKTEDELESVLEQVQNNTDCFSIVNLHFDKMDRSETLYRLTSQLGAKIKCAN